MRNQTEKLNHYIDVRIVLSILVALVLFLVGSYLYTNIISPGAEYAQEKSSKAADSAKQKLKESILDPITGPIEDKEVYEWTKNRVLAKREVYIKAGFKYPENLNEEIKIYKEEEMTGELWVKLSLRGKLKHDFGYSKLPKRVVNVSYWRPDSKVYFVTSFVLIKDDNGWKELGRD